MTEIGQVISYNKKIPLGDRCLKIIVIKGFASSEAFDNRIKRL